MSTRYAFDKIVTNGLILSLDAADRNSYVGSGTVWNDLSGNNYTGNLTNGPTFSSANSGIIVFDGSNDFISGSTPTINANAGMTLSIWVRTTSLGGFAGLIAHDSSGVNIGVRLQLQAGSLQLTFGAVSDYNVNVNIADNIWRHVAASITGSTAIVYINGTSVANLTVGNMFGSPNRYTLATHLSNYMVGAIGSANIYNRSLSASEIRANFNAQKSRFGL